MKVFSGFRACSIAIIVVLAVLTAGCTHMTEGKVPLKVYCAGSLAVPFAEAEREFEALHPEVDVQLEPHGSIQAIRQITDLHRPGDVIAVADESLIPDLMFGKADGDGRNYSTWYLPFGGNEMVIAFTNKSRYSSEITRENWYRILSRPGVKVGLANPMLDASGYRALMVAKLAENEYQNRTLFGALFGDHFDPPLSAPSGGPLTAISLPEIVKPSDDHVVVRDGSIFLISLLETGGIDYTFEYRSVAEGNNLRWISLPAAINLGSKEYAGNYQNITVILGFHRFSRIGTERKGAPIVYAMTIPNSAAHPVAAQEFVDYIAQESGKGRSGWPSPLDKTDTVRK